MTSLHLQQVDYSYNKQENTLSAFSYLFTPGIYGLLGPNGAGKSTLFKIIAGLYKPKAGQLLCDGKDVQQRLASYRGKIGYMPQKQAMYENFTAMEFLGYMSALKGIDRKIASRQIAEILDRVGMLPKATEKIHSYSGGMKQRILLAQALLGSPELLILDEPTAGLDPKQRITIRNLISELSTDKIVLIATHVVQDVETIAKEILFIKAGQCVLSGEPGTILLTMQNNVFEIHADNIEAVNRLTQSNILVVSNIVRDADGYTVRVIFEDVPPADSCTIVKPTLEDLYLYLFKEDMRYGDFTS